MKLNYGDKIHLREFFQQSQYGDWIIVSDPWWAYSSKQGN